MVGKAGLGDCVDSFNMGRCFFEAAGCPVLGILINRVPAAMMKKTAGVLGWVAALDQGSTSSRIDCFGILPETEDAFTVRKAKTTGGDEQYSPPGEHNACQITFRAPRPEQLVVEELDEVEQELCENLCAAFRVALPEHTTLDFLDESAGDSGEGAGAKTAESVVMILLARSLAAQRKAYAAVDV